MRIAPETRSNAGAMGVLRMILNKDMPSENYVIFSWILASFFNILTALVLETHSCALVCSLINFCSDLFKVKSFVKLQPTLYRKKLHISVQSLLLR